MSKVLKTVSIMGVAFMALALTLPTLSAQPDAGGKVLEKVLEVKGDPYTLKTCAVSGKELGGAVITKEIDGREVRFCCEDCVVKFEKEPGKYWKKVDAEIIKQQLAWYPEMPCPVSGGKLEGMGGALNYVYKNRLVRFCCDGCIKKFEKDPAQYLAQIDAAVITQQVEDYPLEKCIISDGALDGMGGAVDKVYANRLVRYCCGGCIKSFMKNPAKYFAIIDKAYGENSPANPDAESMGQKKEMKGMKGGKNHQKGQGKGG